MWVEYSLTTFAAEVGAPTSVVCDVTAFPFPSVEWKFNGQVCLNAFYFMLL